VSMTETQATARASGKFSDLHVTADGQDRAQVRLEGLKTLWFNTGTLCNLACATCYIESTPTNDRLVYLSRAEALRFLDEIAAHHPETEEIGFTGGEPFMNPDFLAMVEDAAGRGYRVLILTNAMRPMQRLFGAFTALCARYPGRITVRVSLDHFTKTLHEFERGPRSWDPAIAGLRLLAGAHVPIDVATRSFCGQSEATIRQGFAALFENLGLPIDAWAPDRLVVFPDMDERADVPEITTACWSILNKRPSDVMCASQRMVVHRKGEPRARVAACTLLPYAEDFDLGETLRDAPHTVHLNHPHCAKFCVLGGASCSG